MVACSATRGCACDAGRPRFVAPPGGLHRRRDSFGNRCCPVRPGRRRRAGTGGVQRSARARAGIRSKADDSARPRESRRAPRSTRQLDGACGRGAVRTREVLSSALGEANLEMPAANSTAIEKYIALAESGAVAMLEAAADRSYLASAIQIASAYEVLAAAAESIPRMRAMREYLAATGCAPLRRSRRQGKCLAATGDRFVGDRVRTAASRAWAANPDGAAAQSRRIGGALSEIQMDLRTVLPERA